MSRSCGVVIDGNTCTFIRMLETAGNQSTDPTQN